MRITPDDLTDPAAVALLEEHVTELRSMSPPDSTHALDLETGSDAFFAPARVLYAVHVFTPCPPFGSYRPDPLSTFMTLEL